MASDVVITNPFSTYIQRPENPGSLAKKVVVAQHFNPDGTETIYIPQRFLPAGYRYQYTAGGSIFLAQEFIAPPENVKVTRTESTEKFLNSLMSKIVRDEASAVTSDADADSTDGSDVRDDSSTDMSSRASSPTAFAAAKASVAESDRSHVPTATPFVDYEQNIKAAYARVNEATFSKEVETGIFSAYDTLGTKHRKEVANCMLGLIGDIRTLDQLARLINEFEHILLDANHTDLLAVEDSFGNYTLSLSDGRQYTVGQNMRNIYKAIKDKIVELRASRQTLDSDASVLHERLEQILDMRMRNLSTGMGTIGGRGIWNTALALFTNQSASRVAHNQAAAQIARRAI